ncbi:MAG: NUDIX domain-containing protein, partial [Clostridia bacterium]|nr:NUDIX domain-containing protein [Clostridia bacterium]
ERSCGAVVYRIINDEVRYLLIKNRRSTHWGFPKGHIEKGETNEQTAMREVLEETGIHIQILPQFASKSEYTIQGRVEKSVTIFLAKTKDTQTTIQREEIEDYVWLSYEKAMDTLRFINDRNILRSAHDFLVEQNIIE